MYNFDKLCGKIFSYLFCLIKFEMKNKYKRCLCYRADILLFFAVFFVSAGDML